MANRGHKPGSKVGAAKVMPRRRTVFQMMAVLDDTLTGLLENDLDVRKANAIVHVTDGWMRGLNTVVRAARVQGLPEIVRGMTALPAGRGALPFTAKAQAGKKEGSGPHN